MPKSTSKTRSRRSLHITPANTKALNAIAKLRGISFNAALNVVLAEALGKPVPAKAFREAMLHQFVKRLQGDTAVAGNETDPGSQRV